MSITAPEWEHYVEAWEADELPESEAGTLSAALRRRRLGTCAVVLGEGALTAALMALTWSWSRDPESFPGAWALIGTWVVWLIATVFAWWNRRGQWVVDVATLEAFAELSLERSARKIRVVWFSWGLTVVQLALLWAIVGHARALFWTVAASTVGIMSAWSWWYYRRAAAERDYFSSLLDESKS